MRTLKLILFSIEQLSALGYWQAGAEMFGGDERRAYADAHRGLQIEAAEALQKEVKQTFRNRLIGLVQRAMMRSA